MYYKYLKSYCPKENTERYQIVLIKVLQKDTHHYVVIFIVSSIQGDFLLKVTKASIINIVKSYSN